MSYQLSTVQLFTRALNPMLDVQKAVSKTQEQIATPDTEAALYMASADAVAALHGAEPLSGLPIADARELGELPGITEALLSRGVDDDIVRGILGANHLRLLRQTID